MMEFLRNWVLNIVVLSVFIVLLEILVPSGKTKKIVNLVTGLILLIALIQPLLGLYKKGVDINTARSISSNYIDKYEIEHDSSILKESQMKQITGLYKQRLVENIKQSLSHIKGTSITNVDVEIDDNHNNKNYGNINKINIKVKKESKDTGKSNVKKVEKVEVGLSGRKTNSNEEVEDETAKKIKDEVAGLLDVDKAIISVSYDE